MGVYELQTLVTNPMHWQQHHQDERLGYDPSRDHSPNLPCQESSSSSSSTAGGTASCCSTSGPCCKEEPCPSPKPPVVCAGCNSNINDRFYLFAVDRRWHASCLQCSQCRAPLDREVTCFARDGSIFCKKDYYRLFGLRRCGRCGAGISSSELVMRAREQVYHVGCFSCAVCAVLLTKGDTFGMRDGAVFCRLHYEPPAVSPPYEPPPCSYLPPHDYPTPPQPQDLKPPPPPPPQQFFNGAPTPPRQKGRPRKRKPKDIDPIAASLGDLGSEGSGGGYLDFGSGGLSNGGGHQRTKRMRTSFKHHQLRTMKSYFAINHNPDAKDLKQLSQKTGLPKRVLQVWFQNARAKWRRMLSKQEGIKEKEGGLEGGGGFHGGSPTSYLSSSPLECSS